MKIRKMFLAAVSVLVCSGAAMADPDPDFRIFLCIGQSNMVGQGVAEAVDRVQKDRFQFMPVTSCFGKDVYKWKAAVPPLSYTNCGLGPSDYFGRTMIQYLPDNVRVGVIVVAVNGTAITLFDPDKQEEHMKNVYADASLAYQVAQIEMFEDKSPLKTLIKSARLAQKDGVISGILLHQGETDAYNDGWCEEVKKIYEYILQELDLNASDVPLIAGEVVRGDATHPGQCTGANTYINKLPKFIKTAYVVTSNGCSCGMDYLHFNTGGYRMLGRRYAQAYLEKYLGISMSGVGDIAESAEPDQVYTLEGYPLAAPRKGLNIINGRKYLIHE